VPTTRPRHTITETPPVQAALDELRAKLGAEERIDFAELLTLGAQVKARRLTDLGAVAARAVDELADWVQAGGGPAVDVAAADEVKRLGLIENRDE
jgi:hypothetical protein